MKDNITYYPLTSSQRGIWYTQKLYPDTSIGNIGGTLKIKGVVDYNLIEKSINKILEKNDGIRIKLVENGDIPLQYVSDYYYHKIDFFDFSKESIDAVYDWDMEQTRIPFMMTESELFYFAILKINSKDSGIFIKIHHILSDAWSFAIIMNKIMEYYYALSENHEISSLNSPSYIDHIISEEEYQTTDRFQKDRKYWNDKFGDSPEITTLKVKKAGLDNNDAIRKTFTIPQKLNSKINSFCSGSNISPFTLFLASLGIYCGMITGRDDIIIGTPILNRSNVREKEMQGMFISTVPIRIKIDENAEFEDFLKYVSKEWMENLRHQKYPYDVLLREMREKNENFEDFFDIVLSYQNARVNKGNNGMSLEARWHFNGYQKNSLSIHINDREGRGNLVFDYDYLDSAYCDREIEFIHEHLIRILWHAIDSPKKEIYRLNMLSEKEKDKVLYDFNDTRAEYRKGVTIHEIFEEQVERTPNSTALIFNGIEMTYREINERANQLARILKDNGVKRESVVGLMVSRSPWLITGILAIMKAGGAFLPCDPEYPDERIRFMLEDCNAKLLLKQECFEKRLNQGFECIVVDKGSNYPTDVQNLPCSNSPSDLAYIIYTSGSTGNPKGVMIEHKSVVSFISGISRILDYSPGTTVLSITTMAFDVFVMEILPSLCYGLKIVLANEDEQKMPGMLLRLMHSCKVEKIFAAPSRYQMLVDDTNCESGFRYLKEIVVGGETISDKLLNDLRNLSSARIFNSYGPTETTVAVTFKDITDVSEINIGRPIANTGIYILDKHLNPMPIGVPGEIYIFGESVGRGYLNRPEMTAERFVDNPFAKEGRMYRTGDKGRWFPKGEIQFLGRLDYQVKIRGFRIEPSEIESRLMEYDGIKESVVSDWTDVNGSKYLCAYLVSPKKIKISDLRAFLSKILPKYMIPTSYVQLDKMPVSQNGKIDRKALPEPQPACFEEMEYSEPADETEERLAQIWCRILHLDRISMNDNFFDLGADSLDIISFVSAVSKEMSMDLSLSSVYNSSTVRELKNKLSVAAKYPYIPVKPSKKRNYYPLSPSQKRLFILSQIEGSSLAYNMPFVSLLEGSLDKERLISAFSSLVERYDSFRTSFEIVDGNPVQVVKDKVDFQVEFIRMDESEADALANAFVKPFDLGMAPLIRVHLVETGTERNLLLWDMHHIISDGITSEILMKELNSLYKGEDLPYPKLQYKDYVMWRNSFIETEFYKRQKEFWMKEFAEEVPVLDLPFDFDRPAVQNFEGRMISTCLESQVSERVRKLASETGVTLYMMLLAVYNILLWRYTGQEDIIVGTPVSGRRHSDLEEIVGIFINMLSVKNHVSGSKCFLDFLKEVSAKTIDNFENQDYPFEELVSSLQLKRDLGRNPLFDTVFVFQRTDITDFRLEGLKITPCEYGGRMAKFDMAWEVFDREDGIHLNIEYCSKMFKEETILKMARHFKNILKSVTARPDTVLRDIEMLDDSEKLKLLCEFNNTSKLIKNKTIHQMITEQAEITPGTPALIFRGMQMSYRELNARANRIAHCLREKGVKPDVVVGIMVKRSFEMITGIIGILKAGGAYLPIDPGLPDNRATYMLVESKAGILLTQAGLADRLDFKGSRIYLDDEDLYSGDCSNLPATSSQGDLSYVIFTSGSTGKPKGVMLTQVAVSNLAAGISGKIGYESGKTILNVTTMSFDIFMVETLLPLAKGLTVIIADEEQQTGISLLLKLISDYSINMIQMTPSRLKMLIEGDRAETRKHLESVTEVMVGGEAFPDILLKRLKLVTGARIFNMYAPSETTVYSTVKELTNTDCITIGNPISNTSVYILDEYLRPVPIGVTGEIYIGGAGVARGYVNNESLTEERFLVNPFANATCSDTAGKAGINSNEAGPNRIYRTGDMARWHPDGEIVYLGRKDRQIKIRGYRIELDEVEQKLLSLEWVTEAAVVDRERAGNRYLCAYLTTKEKKELPLTKLRKFLSEDLPDYMIPSFFVKLDKIPLTPSGKIDRKMLPEPGAVFSDSYEEPGSEVERLLADTWSETLGLGRIGVTDNFFELGGDSLSAILIQTRLCSKNIGISTQDFYRYQTIREMAEKMDGSPADEYNLKTGLVHTDLGYANLDAIEETAASAEPSGTQNDCGVLLTGATGFLGIHILNDLIKYSKHRVYCLIRGKSRAHSEERLRKLLDYYFGDEHKNLLGKRIFIETGDITMPSFGLTDQEYALLAKNTDIVIHAAANVKHYGDYKKFEDVNVGGTVKILKFASESGKVVFHISTMSVSGVKQAGETGKKAVFTEKDLYIGQDYYDNVYVRSKFEAEKHVIDAMRAGLQASLIRVGNLTGRYSDGRFQINIDENAFYNRVRSILELGSIPRNIASMPFDMTPVDYCGKAIVSIVENMASKRRVYHLCSSKMADMRGLLETAREMGDNIDILEWEDFKRNVDIVSKDENERVKLTGIIQDLDNVGMKITEPDISVSSQATEELLGSMGFKWPDPDPAYYRKVLGSIKSSHAKKEGMR